MLRCVVVRLISVVSGPISTSVTRKLIEYTIRRDRCRVKLTKSVRRRVLLRCQDAQV